MQDSHLTRTGPIWLSSTVVFTIVAGFVGLGLFVASFGSQGLSLLVIAVAGILVGTLILMRPQLGIYALFACAAAVRIKVGTGTGSPLVASLGCALALCMCWFVSRHLHRLRINLLPRQVWIPGLLLIFFTGFSLLWSRATIDPRIVVPDGFIVVQVAGGLLYVLSVGLLFVGADLFRDRETRNWIVFGLLAMGLLALPFQIRSVKPPFLSVFGLFGTWFVALAWSHALGNTRLHVALRGTLGALALGWLAIQSTIQFDWTSGWLPPSIALIGVTAVYRPRIGLTLVGIGVVALLLFPQLLEGVMKAEEQQGSLGGDFGRFELWARNVEVLKDQILFGTGPAGYALYYITFIPAEAMSSHSNYIDVLAQLGVPGLLSFLALLGGISWLGWRTIPLLTECSDRSNCVAVLGAMPAILVGMALGDWVVPFVYNQTIAGFDHSVYTWLMFAIACGLWSQHHFPQDKYS